MKSKDQDVIRLQPWVKPESVFNYSTFNCDACVKVMAEKMGIPIAAMTEFDFVKAQLDMCFKQAYAWASPDAKERVKETIVRYRAKEPTIVAKLLVAIHADPEQIADIMAESMNNIHMRLIGKHSYFLPKDRSLEGSLKAALTDKEIN